MTRAHGHPRRDPTRRLTLLGAAAILLVLAVGYVAYRANLGLPGESRYEFFADVPDADRLIAATDVRIGGVLVGEVLSARAEPAQHGGVPYARLRLAISPSAGPLPVDSTVQVRPASVLGLTYVDLHRGSSRRGLAAGGTLPLARARPSSDLTDLFDVFTRGSARGFQRAAAGLGYGLAGRGSALNSAIAATGRLLGPARAVAAHLASDTTRLGPFLNAYETAVDALTPVATALGTGFGEAATTFGALTRERAGLATAIDAAPGAEAATQTAFTAARPALDGLAQLARGLRPAGALLPGTLGAINATLAAGITPLRGLPAFSAPLGSALVSVDGLARDPNTRNSLRKLVDVIRPTNGVLAQFTPAQLGCDVLGLWGVNFSSTFAGQGDGPGPSLPNLVITGAGARGETLQNGKPSSNLNSNPLPIETPGHCESGNEPYTGRQQLNNLPGFTSPANRTTTPPPGVHALAQRAGLLRPIPGDR